MATQTITADTVMGGPVARLMNSPIPTLTINQVRDFCWCGATGLIGNLHGLCRTRDGMMIATRWIQNDRPTVSPVLSSNSQTHAEKIREGLFRSAQGTKYMKMLSEEILSIVSKHVSVPEDPSGTGFDSDLENQGLNSVTLVELFLGLEEHFGLNFSDTDLQYENFRTLRSITTIVSNAMSNN